MTESARITLDDPATWLPLDGLAPGFDAYRAAPSAELTGDELAVRQADGTPARYRFDEAGVFWGVGERGAAPVLRHSRCEVVRVADGLYAVQVLAEPDDGSTHTLFLDRSTGRTLAVTTAFAEPGARPWCTQRFAPGELVGAEIGGAAAEPAGDLIGRRVLWRYSPEHAYEHTYLSGHWYAWQCLSGPERGLADTDACSTYRLRPGCFVFAWREKVVPCAAVTVADHVNMRSHGMLFGRGTDGRTTQFTFGAHGRLLSVVTYPDGLAPDPAA
jgi:hypothetical protein